MKIIIPITCGFSSQGGWRVLSELANNWKKQGHNVSFLVHRSSNLPYFPTQANIVWFDNNGNISESNDLNYKLPFTRYFGIAYALTKALKKQSCDIVLATLSLSALPIFLSFPEASKFYYVQAYEPTYYPLNKLVNFIYKLISKASYYLGFKIIVNSEYYFDYKGIKSNRCVYPGIDFSIFYPKKEKIINPQEKVIVGTIGRIEKYKGTYYILEAFNRIKASSDKEIELHVAFGDEQLNEIDGVKVINIKGDKQLADYYRSLDVYICAGTYQLGAVHYPVIEAMACGTSVITTGYFPSKIDNAWLVGIKSSDEIVSQINNVLSNPEEAFLRSKKALNDVKEFDWDIVSKKMIYYFNE